MVGLDCKIMTTCDFDSLFCSLSSASRNCTFLRSVCRNLLISYPEKVSFLGTSQVTARKQGLEAGRTSLPGDPGSASAGAGAGRSPAVRPAVRLAAGGRREVGGSGLRRGRSSAPVPTPFLRCGSDFERFVTRTDRPRGSLPASIAPASGRLGSEAEGPARGRCPRGRVLGPQPPRVAVVTAPKPRFRAGGLRAPQPERRRPAAPSAALDLGPRRRRSRRASRSEGAASRLSSPGPRAPLRSGDEGRRRAPRGSGPPPARPRSSGGAGASCSLALVRAPRGSRARAARVSVESVAFRRGLRGRGRSAGRRSAGCGRGAAQGPSRAVLVTRGLVPTDALDFVTQWLEEAAGDLADRTCGRALPAGGGAAGSGDAPVPVPDAAAVQDRAYLRLLRWDHLRRPFPEVGAAAAVPGVRPDFKEKAFVTVWHTPGNRPFNLA